MKRRNKPEIKTKDKVVSEICIETENKGNILSTTNNIPKFHKKEKIFLAKKRESHKSSPENHYFFNNEKQKIFLNFMNQFSKKGAFSFFEKTQNPFMNHYLYNIQKKPNTNRQIQTTLIINNYINIENSHEQIEQIENNEKNSISMTPKFNYFESTSISTSNSIQLKSNQQENYFPKNKFNVIKDNDENYEKNKKINENKKRGRKSIKIGKRQHSALDQDNIIRKIQVHFLSFIIDFTNDLIHSIFPNDKNMLFKSINYEYKKTVNHSYILELFSKKIGEIVQLDASPKNKKFNKNINKIIYDKLSNIDILKKFFQISYLDMFSYS